MQSAPGIIVYVGFAQADEWRHWAATYAIHTAKFEAASKGIACITIPYTLACTKIMNRLAPRAVIMSGFARSFQEYELDSFQQVLEWLDASPADLPILALCGSHQLLGFHYNGQIADAERLYDEPMRKLKPGEPVTNPEFHPDHFMEKGFYSLNLTSSGSLDPLFDGLAESPVFLESHYCEIKSLPPGFDLLASTTECRIQAMRSKSRKLYGVQFHPEDYTDRFPAGRRLLENFLRDA